MTFLLLRFPAKTIFGLWFLFAFSCNKLKYEKVLYSYTLTSTDTLNYDGISAKQPISFRFKNNSETEPVSFGFYKKNGINYRDASTMLASVIDKKMSDEQKAIAIWKLAALSGFSYAFDYDHFLQDNVDPIALVTFPYFLCGEKAGIVANLALLTSLPAHRVSLAGHVVAEIKYNGAWHLFDADENCIFRDSSGNILSVEHLAKHPEWISEPNMELLIKNNFFRFNRYKKYLEYYEPGWIDTTFIIHNYSFPNSAITLYPQDEVEFNLIPTSVITRSLNPRYLFDTQGILKRKMNTTHSNTSRANDTLFLFGEVFPYYVTELEVSSQTPANVNVYLKYQNRETLKTEKEYLGNLNKQTSLIKKFNAPSKSDIYYRYQLEFENLSANSIEGIVLQHKFEFNSLTFPLHQSGDKIITTDNTGHTNILFQIRKE